MTRYAMSVIYAFDGRACRFGLLRYVILSEIALEMHVLTHFWSWDPCTI